MIDRSKELPVLYESDAKDSITLYLKNEEIQRLIEEADDENEAVQLQAAEILAIFRECGWIKATADRTQRRICCKSFDGLPKSD